MPTATPRAERRWAAAVDEHQAALAAYLALGADLATAAARAAAFVARQLHLSRHWTLGRGRGPVAHVHAPVPPTQGAPA